MYEFQNIKSPSDLLKYDSSEILNESMFEEDWLRLVVKQATGTGKTKVLALVIAWAYFHKKFIKNSELSNNFLLLSPNTIVLDRLKNDFDGLKIFNDDPIIPPDGYENIDWDFNLKVHIQDNITSISNEGNLFLTNIQRFANRKNKTNNNSLENYFLGPEIKKNNSNDKSLVRNVVQDLEHIVVLNDEAHHIHDKKLAWFKTIQNIHLGLLQKKSSLNLQIDTTATPKHQNGGLFVQIISDYPLVEAIAQNVVKTPVLPDGTTRAQLSEKQSSKFSERFKDYIDLGVHVWEKDYEQNIKLGKKSLLFIMVDDTKNCDDVNNYIVNKYHQFKNNTFVIHTNKDGSFNERNDSKSQKDLNELRQTVLNVDNEGNDVKIIISVLMLKEGWDVKNVTTVIGLRPFSSESNILPEQALGRGLRRMYNDPNIKEELNVLGTDAFLDFVDSISSEGVLLEKRPINYDSEPSGPTLIEIDKTKDVTKLDIKIPILTNRVQRKYKDLNQLDVSQFNFKSKKLKKFTEKEKSSYRFVFLNPMRDSDKTVAKEYQLDGNATINSTTTISWFVNLIKTELRLIMGMDILYEKLKDFISNYLFDENVDINDLNVLKNLREADITNAILKTFKENINKLTIKDIGSTEILDYIKIGNTKPFMVPRTSEYLIPQKSLFNKITADSHFELQFAAYLDNTSDVISFVKNFPQIHFKIEYVKHDGGIGSYYPDFIVKLSNKEFFVIETKGLENLDDSRKINRLKTWCEDATKITNNVWKCLYIRQSKWDKLRITPKTFSEIIDIFQIK